MNHLKLKKKLHISIKLFVVKYFFHWVFFFCIKCVRDIQLKYGIFLGWLIMSFINKIMKTKQMKTK